MFEGTFVFRTESRNEKNVTEGMSFIINGLAKLIGTVLPCFYSYKMLKKPTNEKLKQVVQYWTIYGAYSTVDWFANTFFITYLIPFYDILSLLFVLYITLPQTGGSNFVYKKIFAPFLRQKEKTIDRFLNKVYQKVWDLAPSILSNAASCVLEMLGPIMLSQPMIKAIEPEIQEDDLDMSVDEIDQAVEVKIEPIDYSYGDDEDVMIVEQPRRRTRSSTVNRRRSTRNSSKNSTDVPVLGQKLQYPINGLKDETFLQTLKDRLTTST